MTDRLIPLIAIVRILIIALPVTYLLLVNYRRLIASAPSAASDGNPEEHR